MPKGKRSTATYLRRIGAKNLRKKFDERVVSHLQTTGWASRQTGKMDEIRFYGRLFLSSFPTLRVGRNNGVLLKMSKSKYESQVALVLFKKISNGSEISFQAKLGFDPTTVFVEAFQGQKPNPSFNPAIEVDALNSELGMPWPNYLLKKIEQHAKRLGFKRVYIHDPRTSKYFDQLVDLPALSKPEEAKVKARVEFLKKRVAAKKSQQLSKGEIEWLPSDIKKFFVIDGKLLADRVEQEGPRVEAFWREFFGHLYKAKQVSSLKKQIINFTSWVAKNNGYKKSGEGFEKIL